MIDGSFERLCSDTTCHESIIWSKILSLWYCIDHFVALFLAHPSPAWNRSSPHFSRPWMRFRSPVRAQLNGLLSERGTFQLAESHFDFPAFRKDWQSRSILVLRWKELNGWYNAAVGVGFPRTGNVALAPENIDMTKWTSQLRNWTGKPNPNTCWEFKRPWATFRAPVSYAIVHRGLYRCCMSYMPSSTPWGGP